MIGPEAMLLALRKIDFGDGPVDESPLAETLTASVPEGADLTDDEKRGAFALVAGSSFQREWGTPRSPWGIYWSERSTWTRSDGSPLYMPDVADVRDDTLACWIELSTSLRHPMLIARFADLAWEIGRHVRAKRKGTVDAIATELDPRLACAAIDGYLAVVEEQLFKDEIQAWQTVQRALSLSTAINDAGRVERSKNALFALKRGLAAADQKYMWWKFDDLCSQYRRGLSLSAGEEAEIRDALRTALREATDLSNPDRFDPHAATSAAEHLAKRLTAPADHAEAVAAKVSAAVAFERAADKATAMVAVAWLEQVIQRYRELGMPSEAARVERRVRDLAGAVKDEMTVVSVDLDITKEEVDNYVDETSGESFEAGARNIARSALMRRASIEASVKRMLDEAPLFARVDITIQHPSGFRAATIGSVEGDLPGRVIHQASDQIGHYSPMLNMVFAKWREKHNPGIDDFATLFHRSAAFTPERLPLVLSGLQAWLDQDALKSIHVLVPQIECAIREMMILLGGPVMTYDPNFGGFKAATLGSLLSSDLFAQHLPVDIIFHIRALYSDPKGLNLRNQVAHGLATSSMLTMNMANWVVHTIVVLGVAFQKRDGANRADAS